MLMTILLTPTNTLIMFYEKNASEENENVIKIVTLFSIILATSVLEVYLLFTSMNQLLSLYGI